jgi:dihydropteroate synthase
VELVRPLVAGILNVTPDSFSDGGRYDSIDRAVTHAAAMVKDGADLLDVGGESTRPGARRITESEELHRVLPVVHELVRRFPGLLLSVDTTRASVALAVLDAGVHVVNDVSALRLEPHLADVVASYRAGLILMHSRGNVEQMAGFELAAYGGDVTGEVAAELRVSAQFAISRGINASSVVLDPGIGFAKRPEHSIHVLRGLRRLTELGFPIMVGASRKRVIGYLTGVDRAEDRRDGSVGVHVAALAGGARLFRVHDVKAHRHALDAAWGILG